MKNEVSLIIQNAKSLRVRIDALERGINRRDGDLKKLREDLNTERGKFHLPEFVIGMLTGGSFILGGLVIMFSQHHG